MRIRVLFLALGTMVLVVGGILGILALIGPDALEPCKALLGGVTGLQHSHGHVWHCVAGEVVGVVR